GQSGGREEVQEAAANEDVEQEEPDEFFARKEYWKQ
ncbi:unnamed protein product, partial [marine sediment metagenome]